MAWHIAPAAGIIGGCFTLAGVGLSIEYWLFNGKRRRPYITEFEHALDKRSDFKNYYYNPTNKHKYVH